MDIKKIIQTLTPEEKVALLAGRDTWHMRGIESAQLLPLLLTDGPHGIRKQEYDVTFKQEVTKEATCFPTASLTSCSWDKDVLKEMGNAIAQEASALAVDIVLGPGLNIKKSGFNGRNFEYVSEDPFLTGHLGASFIKAMEKEGIMSCPKHFALNNYETRRMSTNVVVDQRALREIYLKGFEIAIKEGKPSAIMTSYNRVNGTYATEHPQLLHDILRKEWKYEGLIMSDWGATNNRLEALHASMDLEMPGPNKEHERILLEALENGSLSEDVLDESIQRVIETLQKKSKKTKTVNYKEHHELAKKIAGESIVLLKNKDEILPLRKTAKLAVIGEFAEIGPVQGAGSSLVTPTITSNLLESLEALGARFRYKQGFVTEGAQVNPILEEEALSLAMEEDYIIYCMGLDRLGDSEGADRESFEIPKNQLSLLKRLSQLEKPIIVILSGGTSVAINWDQSVDAMLYVGLYGQNGASAVADILFGSINPSGKLSSTFLQKQSDDVFYQKVDIQKENVLYKDSIFVGYRYYETIGKEVAYPFGHGLSYTEFLYHPISCSNFNIEENETVEISFTLENTGTRAGKEVVELYVEDIVHLEMRPKMELKGFEKIYLRKGASKEVQFVLDKSSFSYYCSECHKWVVPSGFYKIHIGSSVRDIRQTAIIHVSGKHKIHSTKIAKVYTELPARRDAIKESDFQTLFQEKLPLFVANEKYHENSTLYDIQHTLVGRIMLKMIQKEVSKWAIAKNPAQIKLIEASALHTPLRSLKNMSNGKFKQKHLEGVLLWTKQKYFRALWRLLVR